MHSNQSGIAPMAVACVIAKRNLPYNALLFADDGFIQHLHNILNIFFKKIVYLLLIALLANHGSYAQNCTVNAGVNQQVCGTTATLSGNRNGSTNGNLVWSFVSGPATPVIVTPNSVSTNVTGMSESGVYTFKLSQLCQDGSTASQNVTITAYPSPIFTAGTDFSYCGYTDVKTMEATLPAGWTGIWRVEDATSSGSIQTSAFTFSNINSPTTTVSAPSCPRLAYRFVWEVTSPNGQCKYSKNIIGRWNPTPDNIAWSISSQTLCMGTGASYPLAAGKCGFYVGYNPGYSLAVDVQAAPAGFSGSLSASTNVLGTLFVNGFTAAGNYTYNVNLSSPCGNRTYGPFSVTILPARPTVTNNTTADFCIKNAPSSVSFNLTMSSADVVFSIASVTVPSGADPLSTSISASGTTRTILATPASQWKPGSYILNWSVRSNDDVNSNCVTTGSSVIQVYDSVSIPMNMPDLNTCIPVGSSTSSVIVTLPPYPNYFTADYGPRYSVIKLSGPAGGNSVTSNYYGTTATLTGLQSGVYSYRVIPAGTYIVNEYACSPGPYADTFSVRVYSTPGANAGTDQTTTCIQNFPLAANAIISPSYGTWSQVSGPSIVSFSNVHNPNASTSVASSPSLGDYTFRWTVQDSAGSCAVASDDVVLHLISDGSPAGVDQAICSYTTATMAGIGTGTWSARAIPANPGMAVITSPSANNTIITGFDAPGVYGFVWDYGCDKDTVLITVKKPNAGIDKTACQFNQVTMTGVGTGVWAAQTGNPGSATITNASSPTTTVTGFSWPGIYNYIWASDGCTDTTKVTVSTCQGTGTNICSSTQIYPRPVEGAASRVSLIISVDISVPGTFAVAVTGSGMTIAQGFSGITASSTGFQNFTIPLVYDGSTLGAFSYTITGAGTCNATLNNNPSQRICDLFSLDNCLPPVVGPSLQ